MNLSSAQNQPYGIGLYSRKKSIEQLLKYILLAHRQVIASCNEDRNQALCESLDAIQEVWLWPLKRILR